MFISTLQAVVAVVIESSRRRVFRRKVILNGDAYSAVHDNKRKYTVERS